MRDNKPSLLRRIFDSAAKTYQGDIIPKKTRWIYPISGLGRDAVYAIVSTFLLIFVQEAGYLDTSGPEYVAQFGVITALIIAYRVFDAINDPLMGVLIEKIHFKTGKFKPWICLGAWLNSVTVLALFAAPALFSWCHGWGFVAWFAVFYLLWGVTFTINDISFCSMLPALSQDEQQRTKICSTLMIFENLGSFTVGALIPVFSTPETLGSNVYWIAAIIVCALFLIGQTLIFFICPEKKRNLKEEEKTEKPKFSDMFKIVRDNKLVRLMVIVVFLWFLSTFTFNGLMQNVYYQQVGYTQGKLLMTIFSFVQVASVILPNLFMPKILAKYPKMSVFKLALSVMIGGYILFFLYGSPFGSFTFAPSDTVFYSILLFLILVIVNICSGVVYTVIFLFMSNTIEYNEWKFGARKESVIFSLRPFSTKLASSLQQGISSLALVTTGAITVSNIISGGGSSEEIERKIKEVITPAMTWGLKVWAIVVPAILLAITLFITAKFYKLSEAQYSQICKEIQDRNTK